MLTVRREQLTAMRPLLEQEFESLLVDWAVDRQLLFGLQLGRPTLVLRVADAMARARRFGFANKRDLARFLDLDLRLGPAFECSADRDWMTTLLAKTDLTPVTRLFRLESRLERLAKMASEIEQEKPDAAPAQP